MSPIHGHHDPERLEREVKEAAYFAEVAEIEILCEALKNPNLAGQELNEKARKKGREILDARLALVKSMYDGPLPVVKVNPKPWPPARLEAREKGINKYQTEKTCRNGHEKTWRYASNDFCVACVAEQGVRKRQKLRAETQV